MRVGLLVTGPNASGKTTATRQALEPWERDTRLTTVYADNSNRSMFKGTMDEMVARLAEVWGSAADLVVVEGTSRIGQALSRAREGSARDLRVVMTVTSPAGMERMLRTRCAKLGKRYRDDFWGEQALTYESRFRYVNMMASRFSGIVPTVIEMDSDYVAAADLVSAVRAVANEVLGEPRRDRPSDSLLDCL